LRLRGEVIHPEKGIISATLAHVPYYRDLFAAADLGPTDIREGADLSRLPTTSKADLRVGFPTRVTAHQLVVRRGRRSHTSGSTGLPFEFLVDRASETGERVLRPLRAFGPPSEDGIQPMAYRALESAFDAGWPPGRQHYWKSSWLKDLSDEAIEVVVGFATQMPSPTTGVAFQQMHGAAARVDPAATAFPHRGQHYDFLIASNWDDPADSAKNIEWTRTFFEAMQPFLERGVYVNDLGEEDEDRVKAAYGANYERLVALKNKYDPTNLFRITHNIKPTVSSHR
jgi:hypothetical protein